ncbi:MAG: hypothetical protein A2Y76_01195 [Planctomycetes bacterium RBG_13_60_9]|nr:MAG: hypothetical protein A2Y76_01195 [Planctomycetes bacterium RBG_13_60_9]
MKPNPNLDELLCSFMDGELSVRQRTEVQRMAAHDPAVARRLKQLEKSRAMISSLPMAEAPVDMLERIKESLERRTLLQDQPLPARRSAGAWHLAFRQLVSAAAVIALLGVLGVVVYQIVRPVPHGALLPLPDIGKRVSMSEAPRLVPSPVVVADAGFTGRLELRTHSLVHAGASVERAIEDSGLSGRVQPDIVNSRRVYQVVGTRESVNRFVASLSGAWSNFGAATLQMEGPDSAQPVVVESLTPEQAASIVAQNSTEASFEAAKGYAITNYMARNMPGGEIRPLIQDDSGTMTAMIVIPRPKETGPNDSVPASPVPHGKAQVSLTIVLLDAR